MAGDVTSKGHIRHKRIVHLQEPERILYRTDGRIAQILAEIDPDLLPGEHPEIPSQLIVVESSSDVVLQGTLFVDANYFFFSQGLREVIERLRTASHHV